MIVLNIAPRPVRVISKAEALAQIKKAIKAQRYEVAYN